MSGFIIIMIHMLYRMTCTAFCLRRFRPDFNNRSGPTYHTLPLEHLTLRMRGYRCETFYVCAIIGPSALRLPLAESIILHHTARHERSATSTRIEQMQDGWGQRVYYIL